MVYHGLPIKHGVFHVSHNQMVPQNPVLFRPQIPDGFHSLPQLTAPTRIGWREINSVDPWKVTGSGATFP